MRKFSLGFGNSFEEIYIPSKNIAAVLEPHKAGSCFQGEAAVIHAIRNPIGSLRIGEIVRPREKVAIITSDITRPVPSHVILPPLLNELYSCGVSPRDVTLVFALGNHRKHTKAEQLRLVGERAYFEIACEDSDQTNCVHMGVTDRGTPVDITRTVAEADRRICIGNIEFHYFAGYSGGAKAIMPGVSTRDAIQFNHSHMTNSGSCAGRLNGNPVREDIEQAGAICGIDFIVNVVLDEHKQIVHAVAGDAIAAHRSGCRFLDRLYKCRIPHKADIVIVSQGGTPKDINLYQAQKALDNAKYAVKENGIIILISACGEGFGEKTFEQWMLSGETPDAMMRRIRDNFILGGHKAAAIAQILKTANIFLVSHMDPEVVKQAGFVSCISAQHALDTAFERLGTNASVIVMPYGGSTLPYSAP